MKHLKILILAIFTLNTYAQEYYFIDAESGLNVRAESSLSSKKVAKIPFGTMVEKISDTEVYLTINDNGKDIKGQFTKIKYNNYGYLVNEETKQFEREGYVFSAFLKEHIVKDLIQQRKIDKKEYSQLLKKAYKSLNNPIKIKDLDSVKVILKDRIVWETEFQNDNYQREDIIKSITIANGQKLRLAQAGYDFGFSEGYSGYYPEYEILLLEGGHSSDMSFSIKTGETTLTIGNPQYFIPSPNKSHRLNGYYGGQECISYFFQEKINDKFSYLTQFNWDFDLCLLKEFYWLNETEFIYNKMNYGANPEIEYFKGKLNPRIPLPDWFIKSNLLDDNYEIDNRLNPLFLEADFNGDGNLDLAVPIKETKTSKVGFAIVHGHMNEIHIIGAGTPIKNGLSDDMNYIDNWKINRKPVNKSGLEENTGTGENGELIIKNPSLQIEKTEVGGGQIYWNGSEYAYFHQTC